MFDIGFFELVVVALVGLFVIGPEKLPHTIRVLALWIGRIKRSIVETRREIEQQLGADEIRRELHNEQVMRNWEKMKEVRDELEAKIKALGEMPPPPQAPAPVPPPSESASAQVAPVDDASAPAGDTSATPAVDSSAQLPPAIDTPAPAMDASVSEPTPTAPADSAAPVKQANP